MTDSVAAYKVFQTRIDAVEKALEKALENGLGHGVSGAHGAHTTDADDADQASVFPSELAAPIQRGKLISTRFTLIQNRLSSWS